MNISVGNLSPYVSEKDLKSVFLAFGQVKSVSVRRDGIGFVAMPERDKAIAAIRELHGQELKGRRIHVVEAVPRSVGKKRSRISRKIARGTANFLRGVYRRLGLKGIPDAQDHKSVSCGRDGYGEMIVLRPDQERRICYCEKQRVIYPVNCPAEDKAKSGYQMD